ncbi:MAG TPA: DegV family protein [Acidimicrobiales bacterium]|jgi:DegV family protein with EDD domain|nr:DegV family protein [Acidimicrobiales bacterium]
MPVRIVTDSACDLDQALVDQHGIEVVPLSIRFGDDEFVDRIELSNEEFYARMAASDTLPETAAPSPGAFEQAFRKQGASGDAVVCINLSAALSATMQSAATAAASLEGEIAVTVVDSKALTLGLGNIVVAAAEAAAAGASPTDIEAKVEDLSGRTRMWGMLDTLDNLLKGGRIGKAQQLMGSVLSIKPILDMSTGEVHEAAKPRTHKKGLLWLRDKVLEFGDDIETLWVMAGDPDDAGELVDLLAADYTGEIGQGRIGPVIGTHGGPGVLGVTFWVKP